MVPVSSTNGCLVRAVGHEDTFKDDVDPEGQIELGDAVLAVFQVQLGVADAQPPVQVLVSLYLAVNAHNYIL